MGNVNGDCKFKCSFEELITHFDNYNHYWILHIICKTNNSADLLGQVLDRLEDQHMDTKTVIYVMDETDELKFDTICQRMSSNMWLRGLCVTDVLNERQWNLLYHSIATNTSLNGVAVPLKDNYTVQDFNNMHDMLSNNKNILKFMFYGGP